MFTTLLRIFLCLVALCFTFQVEAEEFELSKILLAETDLPGFSLLFQRNDWSIRVGSDEYCKATMQQWQSNNCDLRVIYSNFQSIQEANTKIAFFSHSFSGPFFWGSTSGQVIGDKCWAARNANIILCGNIGIQIMSGSDAGNSIVEAISKQLLRRIKENMGESIRHSIESAKVSQIDSIEFASIAEAALTVSSVEEFVPIDNGWDSIWCVDNENFYLGRRMEWRNSKGTIFGVDLCKFKNEIDAINASQTMKNQTYGFSFDMKMASEVDSVILMNSESGMINKVLPISSHTGKTAVLFYMIDPIDIKTDLYIKMVKKIVEKISFQ